MVLSLITLAATAPMLGTTAPMLAVTSMQLQDTAQNQQNQQKGSVSETASESGMEDKIKRCHLEVRGTARMSQARKQIMQNRIVVLRQGKLYLYEPNKISQIGAHPFTGYFLPYPEREVDGIVSTINAEKFLNWIYVDSSTYETKYGVRKEADLNMTGPMTILNASNGEQRLAFAGWEGFLAVEEEPDVWALYFDKEDDGLRSKISGKKVTEIEVIRHVIPGE